LVDHSVKRDGEVNTRRKGGTRRDVEHNSSTPILTGAETIK